MFKIKGNNELLNTHFVKVRFSDQVYANLIDHLSAYDENIVMNQSFGPIGLHLILTFDEGVQPCIGVKEIVNQASLGHIFLL